MRAYKTELDPNDKQQTFLGRCCGAAHFVYNWGLAEWERQYQVGEKPSAYSIKKKFNAAKSEIAPWITQIPYAITESAFRNLGSAFSRYFAEKKSGTVAKRIEALKRNGKWDKRIAKLLKKGRHGYQFDPGYPQFKHRGDDSSFQLRGTKITETHIYVTGLGWVRIKEHGYIPTDGQQGVYATVSERAGRWYVSILENGDGDEPNENMSGDCIGVDFGIKSLAVCSDGTVYDNPHALMQAQTKLNRLQRELSRRDIGGENWKKTKLKIQCQHARIADLRQNTLHDISHDLIDNKHPSVIVIEDLNVSGMMKNHSLAKAISDVGFYELRKQIEYKAKRNGVRVVLADQWFPSSKLCSECGTLKDILGLDERVYRCECGLEIDRDLNAARNLAAYGVKAETQPDCLGS